jgi:hypothetical protein
VGAEKNMPDTCEKCVPREYREPCFPYRWELHGNTVLASYRCPHCNHRWVCWWDRACVGLGHGGDGEEHEPATD